jgi:anti-anti-sigma regulatory factor
LKAALLEAVASGKELRLGMESVVDLDVTALQLLWAAAREAKARSVRFITEGELPERITALIVDAGFDNFPVPLAAK